MQFVILRQPIQKRFCNIKVESNSNINVCKLKFSHILMTVLDTFSYIPGEEFCSRGYDFIKILKMDLCNSESVKMSYFRQM